MNREDEWDTAVQKAADNATEVFKDSCNHTKQAIDYMRSLLQYTYRPEPLEIEEEKAVFLSTPSIDPETRPWFFSGEVKADGGIEWTPVYQPEEGNDLG